MVRRIPNSSTSFTPFTPFPITYVRPAPLEDQREQPTSKACSKPGQTKSTALGGALMSSNPRSRGKPPSSRQSHDEYYPCVAQCGKLHRYTTNDAQLTHMDHCKKAIDLATSTSHVSPTRLIRVVVVRARDPIKAQISNSIQPPPFAHWNANSLINLDRDYVLPKRDSPVSGIQGLAASVPLPTFVIESGHGGVAWSVSGPTSSLTPASSRPVSQASIPASRPISSESTASPLAGCSSTVLTPPTPPPSKKWSKPRSKSAARAIKPNSKGAPLFGDSRSDRA
ncbi:hypothetical protein BDV98DRAFT_593534 [Pterulicium gracile]|uniref:Uncharacterized protein n=1 Tax=Pterulicium gracile TaxID=1884261 RepID=A0A5C3QHA5_9AGAR|nr:hypothetical protein BDV98DRAFT_593534 [Pterula gracilis]